MACEGCCRVDQNETTYMPEKANPIKDDQVLLGAPQAIRPQNMVTAQPAAASPPMKAEAPAKALFTTGEFAGAWEDSAKSVCIISDSTLRWSNNVISKISVSDGKLKLEDADTTASLDDSRNTLTWSDGDIWKRTSVPTEFSGNWQDDSKGIHTIVGTTLKWSNGTISDVMFSGGQLRLGENQLTASLDDSKAKLVWSDGDVWNKTDASAVSSEFVGVWRDSEDKIHTITDTTLNWSNTRSSVVKIDGGRIQVDDINGSATLDETKSKLMWDDGDVWTRTTNAPQTV